MALFNRRLPVPPPTTTSPADIDALVASATRVTTTGATAGASGIKWGGSDWQAEAWAHYGTVPELGRYAWIMANALSRTRLKLVAVDPVTGEPEDTPTADAVPAAIAAAAFGGPIGQSTAMAAMGMHLSVAGECWWLIRDDIEAGRTVWEVLGVLDVKASGADAITVVQRDGSLAKYLLADVVLINVRRDDPAHRSQADSAVKYQLPLLRELQQLGASVTATIKSRLASAGVLWIPDDIEPPQPMMPAGTPARTGAAGWLEALTDQMVTPIQEPDSAAAVVPLVVVASADAIGKVSHTQFGRDIDAGIEPKITSDIRRFSVGVDMPPEVLLGLGDSNHWSAWQITEEFAQTSVAPTAGIPAAALTEQYLNPALEAAGRQDLIGRYVYVVDTSQLVSRQVSAENAKYLWEQGVLSERALFEALGADHNRDAATLQERGQRMVLDLAKNSQAGMAAVVPMLKVLYGMTLDDDALKTAAELEAASAVGPAADPAGPATRPALNGPPVRPTAPPDETPTTPPPAGGAQ